MAIRIIEVKSRKALKDFIKLPFNLYKNNKYWIPPFVRDEWKTLYEHLPSQKDDAAYFLATNGSRYVGRLAVIVLPDERDDEGRLEGRFGWVEFEEDIDIAAKLFEAGEEWLKARGVNVLKGPVGFSNLDKTAMLIEGFQEEPTIVEIYNFPYYPAYLTRLGFEKAIDWIGFEFEVPKSVPDKVTKFSQLIRKRYNLKLIEGGLKNKKPFAYQIFDLINETHKNIHGFIPFTHEKARAYIDKYFPLLDNDFVSLVIDGQSKLVAYGIALPSFTEAFRKSKGALFPWGLWYISRAIKRNDRADLYLIGIADHMRNKGVTAIIFENIMSAFIRKGIKTVESNPELETNQEVQSMWKNYEHRQHKRRRVFKKILS